MIVDQTNGLRLLYFRNLLKYKTVGHFVTTRKGGDGRCSGNDFDLSLNRDKKGPAVLENRRCLSEALKIPIDSITTAKQVHGNRVCIIDESMRGKGAKDPAGAVPSVDALVTQVPGICPMILVADCVPLLLYDPQKKVVGVVHAGWKGTLGRIASKTVRVFIDHFGTSPNDMIAGIGPSIGPCCFQVGPEVVLEAKKAFSHHGGFVAGVSRDGAGYLDLWSANKYQLVQSGLKEKNVELADACTCCDSSHLFFSHRGEKGKAGRFGAGIWIR